MLSIEKHPFESFVPQKAKTLVIGTFPPIAERRDFQFYYPNSIGNKFWVIMENVFNCKFQYVKGDNAVIERKRLFTQKHVALTDIIEKCGRIQNNSSDKNLLEIKYRNVYKLLKETITIEKIILTSRTYGNSEQIHKKHLTKSRNNSALELLNEHLRSCGVSINNLHKEVSGLIKGYLHLNNRNISIFVPYTPTARWYNKKKNAIIDMYKSSFNDC